MSLRSAAASYARALLDVAAAEADPAAVGEQIAGVAGLMASHPGLRDALTSPSVPPSRKRAAVEALAAPLGLAAPVAKLLALLAARDRLALVPEIARSYRQRLEERQQVVRAAVTAAVPLGAAQQAALAERLSQVTGRHVVLDAAVDPSLMGGLVARIGSTVYDGSVRTQLERLRQRLLQ